MFNNIWHIIELFNTEVVTFSENLLYELPENSRPQKYDTKQVLCWDQQILGALLQYLIS
jgi:hypothetical protein